MEKAQLLINNTVKLSFTDRYLFHPLFEQEFWLQTNASKLGLGVELFHIDLNGERRTISFVSKKFYSTKQTTRLLI